MVVLDESRTNSYRSPSYEYYIYRFLRARKFDLVKAKEMLLDCEKWRIDFGVDDIVK